MAALKNEVFSLYLGRVLQNLNSMKDYILFIDIETSDIPRRWNAPTAKVDKWPFILQIAWIVCEKNGKVISTHDYYIRQKNIPMGEVSSGLHGITLDMLEKKGEERRIVLNKLAADIELYEPLIVGHFIEFDKRMLEVGFSREELKRNFDNLPKFCTMLVTRRSKDIFGGNSYLRLNELFETLFDKPLENQHNALSDAAATKDCFFELVRRGQITDQTILEQKRSQSPKWELPMGAVITIALVIASAVFFVLFFMR